MIVKYFTITNLQSQILDMTIGNIKGIVGVRLTTLDFIYDR